MQMKKSEQIIDQINKRVETPFVTPKFGDNWKEHQKKMLDEGQISLDMLLDIAWKQGRRALLMEDVIHDFANLKSQTEIRKKLEWYEKATTKCNNEWEAAIERAQYAKTSDERASHMETAAGYHIEAGKGQLAILHLQWVLGE